MQTKQMPNITVITVVYNGESHLSEAIASIRAQKYKNLEYIIVDGGSTDRTLEIIRDNEDVVTHWVSEQDRGIYDAMNKGVDMASGEVIGILNSDDMYAPKALDRVAKVFLDQNVEEIVIYGDMIKFLDGSEVASGAFFRGDLSGRAMKRMRPRLNHPACFVSRATYTAHGAFNLQYERGADRELMFRMHFAGISFKRIDSVLAYFRSGGCTSSIKLGDIVRLSGQEWRLSNNYNFAKLPRFLWFADTVLRYIRYWILGLIINDTTLDRLRINHLRRKFGRADNDNSLR